MPSTAPNVGADTCASHRRAQRLQGPGWRRDLTSLSLPRPHTGAASRVHFVGLRPPLTPPHSRTPRIRPRETEESPVCELAERVLVALAAGSENVVVGAGAGRGGERAE